MDNSHDLSKNKGGNEPRKQRINLEKTYPAEYVERLLERLAKANDDESIGLTQPTQPVAPQQPAQPVAPQQPTQPTKPSKPSRPSNPQRKPSKKPILSARFIIVWGLLMAFGVILINYFVRQNDHRHNPHRSAVEQATYTFYCTDSSLWMVLDHINSDDRILDSRGRNILDSLLRSWPEEYWLHFIHDKNYAVEFSRQRDTLRFLQPIAYPPQKKSRKTREVDLKRGFWFLIGDGYLAAEDYRTGGDSFLVKEDKLNAAIKQFRRDAGLPDDADMDSKEVSEVISNWRGVWSTKYLGVRPINRMTYGGTDSDELIELLRNSGFITDESRLIKKRQGPELTKTERTDIILALHRAGSEKTPYDKNFHYDIPDDLETCLRAFQAYHGLKPDGLLNDSTIFALRQYK